MRLLAASSKLAFVGTHFACRNNKIIHSSFSTAVRRTGENQFNRFPSSTTSTRLFSSSGGEPQLQNIAKEEMEEIVEDYEQGGREESGYVILDVRQPGEIEYTGKLSPNTLTLPLQELAQYNAFALEEDEFEEIFGFDKPTPDETLVFSCAAGIRSVHAAQFAAQNGYTKLVNYKGGANEWFN